jgi:SAM-dependent methyltransferase
MRLKVRRVSILEESYLAHRYLWRNLEAAVHAAKSQSRPAAHVVLDIGCGQKPYADLFADMRHIGLNDSVEDASPDVVGDGTRLPIASQSIDLVFCTQVLEHVLRPWSLLSECYRVLKPSGWLILSAPFYWPLHEEPHDYFRFTKWGLEGLIEEAGFEECRVLADGGDYARLCLSVIQTLPRCFGVPLRVPLNALGILLDKFVPRATLPANYTVTARVPCSRREVTAA